MSQTPIGHFSMKVLQEPQEKIKGVLVLSQVDEVVDRMPFLRDRFYLVERRGWRGLNESRYADIKLVEDLSLWDKTLMTFPESICLDIGPADFVDTDAFRPLGVTKDYDGIQISHWSDFKRPELFVKGAGLVPHRTFLKLGHFVDNGTIAEQELRDNSIRLAKEVGARIDFPYADAKSNADFPRSKDLMNNYINRARIGVLTTKVEGINRFKMECLSAGIPVIVPKDTSYPTKKHINQKTGLEFEPTPEGLAQTIEDVLTHLERYDPRDYILKTTGKAIALKKLKVALEQICEREGVPYNFADVEWDSRNQSLIWGENVFRELERYKENNGFNYS